MSELALRVRLDRGDFTLDADLQLPASGISAIFGMGNSAAMSGSTKIRTGRNIAISNPTTMPGMLPTKKPANTR